MSATFPSLLLRVPPPRFYHGFTPGAGSTTASGRKRFGQGGEAGLVPVLCGAIRLAFGLSAMPIVRSPVGPQPYPTTPTALLRASFPAPQGHAWVFRTQGNLDFRSA